MQRRLDGAAQTLDQLTSRLRAPAQVVSARQHALDVLAHRLQEGPGSLVASRGKVCPPWDIAWSGLQTVALQRQTWQLDALQARAENVNPQRVLERGYAWLSSADGRPVVSVEGVNVGSPFRLCWLMVLWVWMSKVAEVGGPGSAPDASLGIFCVGSKRPATCLQSLLHVYTFLYNPTGKQHGTHASFPCRTRKTLWLSHSAETFEYHYGKHHQAYVTNLNNLIPGTEFENASLEDIIKKSSGGIYNNAAQIWNHTFFWN